MSRRTATIPADWFDALYRSESDPWRFRTSAYEQAKYRETLGMLDRERYGNALEVGCSIGVFTRLLASRCDSVVAVDVSEVALSAARETCQDLAGVRFAHCALPGSCPDGRFDLIVLSEVLYYLTAADVAQTSRLCLDHLAEGGEIVLCHWLGETDYPLSGDAAAEAFLQAMPPGMFAIRTVRHPEYRLDRLGTASR